MVEGETEEEEEEGILLLRLSLLSGKGRGDKRGEGGRLRQGGRGGKKDENELLFFRRRGIQR